MIVTRQRPKKKLNPRKLILPVVALAALAFALWWPPSQKKIVGVLANGPWMPVIHLVGNVVSPALAPLHFAAQEQIIADRNRQIETLNAQLETQRKDAAAKDSQIAALQYQVKQAQATAAKVAAATPTPAPIRRAANSGSEPVVATVTTDDPKRTAVVWSAMDPEQAAAVASRLPPDYTAKVLAVMSSDSAGSLLGALPPAYAARVSQVSTTVPK